MIADPMMGMLGLARRAGRLIFGTDRVCEGIRRGSVGWVALASDASANTVKRTQNCCEYYHIPLHRLQVDAPTLAHTIGKTGCITTVALTDAGMIEAVRKIAQETTNQEMREV